MKKIMLILVTLSVFISCEQLNTEAIIIAGNNAEISVESVTSTSITLKWWRAYGNTADQADYQYLVYYSTGNNLTSIDSVESMGIAFGDYTADITTLEINRLTENTEYFFNIIVKDEFNNKVLYGGVSGTTDSGIIHPLEIPFITNPDAVVTKLAYTFQYNETFEQADWVAYELTSGEVAGTFDRKDDFRPDPDVVTGSAELDDYAGSGYHRGHMAPAADMKLTEEIMSESFYMSNMSPQTPALNSGKWASLEDDVRNWAADNESVYIVVGPILEKSSYPTIGANEVAVPEFYYKVILDYTFPETKAIAFIMPNQSTTLSAVEDYAVSVDEVENRTGIDFYYQLPDDIEGQLESQFDLSLWTF